MARKTDEIEMPHPVTGQRIILQAYDDGSLRLVMMPVAGGSRQRWALANNYTGGEATRMQIVQVPDSPF